MNREDRNALSEFHVRSNGTSMPANHRDASNSGLRLSASSASWSSDKPTPISVPAPGAHPRSTTSQRTMNPFSGRMSDTLGSKKGGARGGQRGGLSGNNTARAIVLGSPPAKRAKTSAGPSVKDRTLSSKYFDTIPGNTPKSLSWSSPSGTGTGQEAEIIHIPDDSKDPLDLFDDDPPNRPRPPAKTHDFESIDGPGPSRYSSAKDGPSTRSLQQKVQQSREIVDVDAMSGSDPIESASEFDNTNTRATTPHGTTKIKQGLVQARVNKLEMHKKPLPTVDFKAMTKPVKARMKPNSLKMEPAPKLREQDPLATIPSGFVSSSAQTRKTSGKAKSGKANGTLDLPLEAVCFGVNMIKYPDLRMVLDERLKLTIKHGVKSLKELPLDEMVQGIVYTQYPCSPHFPVILKMTTYAAKTRKTKQLGTNGFVQGSTGAQGNVTFKFLTEDDWDPGAYESLIRTLTSRLDKSSHFDMHGSRSCWEVAVNAVELWASTGVPEAASSTSTSRSTRTSSKAVSSKAETASASPSITPSASSARITRSKARPPSDSRRSSLSFSYEPPIDPDEIVLVYPPAGTGAVNITRGDVKRLEPGQYLNDTLIEFGLKLWLNELRASNPELAEQIHVFSSFFYKKVNIKKREEGYQSVRKWTSKFDLFQKKYVVVPINENFHWYLAIICNPDATLQPPPPTEKALGLGRMTRKRKRETDEFELEALDAKPAAVNPPGSPHPPDNDSSASVGHRAPRNSDTTVVPDSEGEEVENMLMQSLSISDNTQPTKESAESPVVDDQVTDEHTIADLDLQYPSSDGPMQVDELRPPSPEEDTLSSPSRLSSLSPEPVPSALNTGGTTTDNDEVTPDDMVVDEDTGSAVPVDTFYASISKKDKGKGREVEPSSAHDDMEDQDAEANEGPSTVDTSKPYIFIFDSLGGTHRQAVNALTGYLAMEAKDKKGLEHTTPPKGLEALVPYQPNYCDCGVYLLHFVKMFMRDPISASRLILTKQKKRLYSQGERDSDWEGSVVSGLRDELRRRTEELSEEWKKDRALKEEQKKRDAAEQVADGSGTAPSATSVVVDDSDDDIIVEDVTFKSKTKPRAKPRSSKPKTETPAYRFR